MKKIHPIWYLAGFSLFIGVLNYGMKEETATAPDYQAAFDEFVTGMTETDALGDMAWRPQYEAAITRLDLLCTEPLSEVVNLSVDEVDRRGDLGKQFAVLNHMENTVYLAQDSPAKPVNCAPLISEVIR